MKGAQTSNHGNPVSYMGRELLSYPSLRCHVFQRALNLDDPVAPDWIRRDNLEGRSVFVGINHPFILDPPTKSEPGAADVDEALPVFIADYVFSTHVPCQHRP